MFGPRNTSLDDLDSGAEDRERQFRRIFRRIGDIDKCRTTTEWGHGPSCGAEALRTGWMLCLQSNRAALDELARFVEALIDPDSTADKDFDAMDSAQTRMSASILLDDLGSLIAKMVRPFCPSLCPTVTDLDVTLSSPTSTQGSAGRRGFAFKYKVSWSCDKDDHRRRKVNPGGPWWDTRSALDVYYTRPVWCPDEGYVEVCLYLSSVMRPPNMSVSERTNTQRAFREYFRQIDADSWSCPAPCSPIEWDQLRVSYSAWKTTKKWTARYCVRKDWKCEDPERVRPPFLPIQDLGMFMDSTAGNRLILSNWRNAMRHSTHGSPGNRLVAFRRRMAEGVPFAHEFDCCRRHPVRITDERANIGRTSSTMKEHARVDNSGDLSWQEELAPADDGRSFRGSDDIMVGLSGIESRQRHPGQSAGEIDRIG